MVLQFNLSAYPAENYVEVVLQNGKVEFHDRKGNRKEILLPSERLVFQNGDISKSVADPAKYSAWTKGMLVFRGDPMAEVARRLNDGTMSGLNWKTKNLKNILSEQLFRMTK